MSLLISFQPENLQTFHPLPLSAAYLCEPDLAKKFSSLIVTFPAERFQAQWRYWHLESSPRIGLAFLAFCNPATTSLFSVSFHYKLPFLCSHRCSNLMSRNLSTRFLLPDIPLLYWSSNSWPILHKCSTFQACFPILQPEDISSVSLHVILELLKFLCCVSCMYSCLY